MNETLTQERLKELLIYNELTGVFVNKLNRGKSKKGDIVGGLTVKGYIRIIIDNNEYFAHRLVWLYVYGEFPKNQLDHINHARDDNRLINLDDATYETNHKNRTQHINNTSGATGITWINRGKRWQVTIGINKRLVYLGQYETFYAACYARHAANIKYGFHENHGKPRQPLIT